ncbi:MAG: hypothetical protein J6S75_07615, partial [Thermoguttaceae bacterium]|nr:hypothetical protein [Thermoguttaceae bacterium]
MENNRPFDKDFLTLLLSGTELSPEQSDRRSLLRRDEVQRPTLFFDTGSADRRRGEETFDRGSAAAATLAAVRGWFADRQVDINDYELVETGSFGLRGAEPMVGVQLPGRNRLIFREVTESVVPLLLSRFFAVDQVTPAEAAAEAADSSAVQASAAAVSSPASQEPAAAAAQESAAPVYLKPVLRVLPIETFPDSLARHLLFQLGENSSASRRWANVPFIDEHPFFARQTRQVLARCAMVEPAAVDSAVAMGTYLALTRILREKRSPELLCQEVLRSGLRGRGGAGFPAGEKWLAVTRASGRDHYIVCNADEGAPGSGIARMLLEGDPHAVIEGLAITAYAVGAKRAFLYVKDDCRLGIERFRAAMDAARAAGLLGEHILGTTFSFDIMVENSVGTMVGGEETAMIRYLESESLEGVRGVPCPRPPYPSESGILGQPTVVHHIETFANIPIIFRGEFNRSSAYRFEQGHLGSSPGTKLLTLSGKSVYTGLFEVPLGTTLRDVVYGIGGGILNEKRFKAALTGGCCGGCVPETQLDHMVDYESLESVGALMGSGNVVVIDDGSCMVDTAKSLIDLLLSQSCGKCAPCREGLRRIADILDQITHPAPDPFVPGVAGPAMSNPPGLRWSDSLPLPEALARGGVIERLRQLCEVVRQTSLCGLG